MIRTKSGAAALSIASNALLIAIKLAAGAITGSIAIVTEAVHSLIDLVASVVAFVSVRKADEPADADHPYGHEKVESLAATIEGMLILVGAGIIVYEATHRLVVGSQVESARRRHRGDGLLGARQPRRLDGPLAPGARRTNRPRSKATPRTCAPTRSPRPACSSAWRWSRSPASSPSTRSPRCSSPRRSSSPGSGSSAAPPACSSTKRCPTRRWTGSRRRSPPPARPRSPATTSCAPAAPAAAATSTSTSSTAPAPASSAPTSSPTRCATRSRRRSPAPRS